MKTSDTIIEISKALCEASKELKNVDQNADNPFYKSKYADLPHIIDTVKETLYKNGLCVIQDALLSEEKHINVKTLLAHISGEWIETTVTVPCTNGNRYDAQTVGGAITYGRRYALSALLNISSEPDDDGNGLVGKEKENNQRVDIEKVVATLSKMTLEEAREFEKEILGKCKTQKQTDYAQSKFDYRYKQLGANK